jgi:hypothetical protein
MIYVAATVNSPCWYRRVDISTDPEARDYVMALGYLQAPVVSVGPDNPVPLGSHGRVPLTRPER